jgi:two-component sensor histidine kinase
MNKLRASVVAMAVLLALALVGLRAVTLWDDYHSSIARAEGATRDWAFTLEQYVARLLEAGDLAAREVDRFARERGGPEALRGDAAAHDLLRQLESTTVADHLMVVDARGVPTAMSYVHPASPISLGDRAWFRAHADGVDRFVGPALFSRITNEVLFTYSRRLVSPSGEFAGVLQVALRPTFFQESPVAEALGRGATIGLWTEDGRLAARTGMTRADVEREIINAPLVERSRRAPSDTFTAVPAFDGVERIVSYRKIPGVNAIVTAGVPVAAATAAWQDALRWSLVAVGVILLVLLAMTLLVLRLSRSEEAAHARVAEHSRELEAAASVTERALKAKELLLREIHHRVKNNLQVTASLLHMQERRFSDQKVRSAFEDTRERLHAIALLHETIYRSDLTGRVELKDYIGRLVDGIGAAHSAPARGIDIEVNAEPISVDLDRAMPIGLTLTETLTNSLKHAFDKGERGRIEVGATRDGDDVEITVRDTGRGIPDCEVNGNSLGLKLVGAFVTQLGGQWAYTNDKGALFRMTFTAPIRSPPSSNPAAL